MYRTRVSDIIFYLKIMIESTLFRYEYRDVSKKYRYRGRIGYDSSPFSEYRGFIALRSLSQIENHFLNLLEN
jgi:hypothetical protein